MSKTMAKVCAVVGLVALAAWGIALQNAFGQEAARVGDVLRQRQQRNSSRIYRF